MNAEEVNALGYRNARLLPNGEWAALQPMMFTTGLFVGITEITWRTRYCFDTFTDAATALETWDGEGFPPGYWNKQKPEGTPNPKGADPVKKVVTYFIQHRFVRGELRSDWTSQPSIFETPYEAISIRDGIECALTESIEDKSTEKMADDIAILIKIIGVKIEMQIIQRTTETRSDGCVIIADTVFEEAREVACG